VRLQFIVQHNVIGVQIGVDSVHRVEKEPGVQDANDSELFLFKSEMIGGMEKVGKRFKGDAGIDKARSMCLGEVVNGATRRDAAQILGN
jgi:hypothetical protein